MSAATLVAGAALLLLGLWHRDRERLAIGLFITGALLVILAGLLAAPGMMPSS